MKVVDKNFKNVYTHKKTNKILLFGCQNIGSTLASKLRFRMTLMTNRIEEP